LPNEKEKFQREFEEMGKKLSQLPTTPSTSSTLKVNFKRVLLNKRLKIDDF